MSRRQRARAVRWAVVVILAATGLGLLGWQMGGTSGDTPGEADMGESSVQNENLSEAIFAGGCFWCIEAAFQNMPGVAEAISGYTGGSVENPTYRQVSTGTTGHVEAVLVRFDPSEIAYEELLDQFWRSIDPTDPEGQFYDRGSQYATAIFYLDEEQRDLAEASKQALEDSGVFDDPIVTAILPAQPFYVAEDFHQDYFEKYLNQYKTYSAASGRDAFLEETWEEGQEEPEDSAED